MCSRSLLLTALLSVTPLQALAADEPVKLTAQDDHERLRGLLKIPELRRGADGRKDSSNPPNYDESKVEPIVLPDPLIFNNGEKVTKPSEWWHRRRAEIVEHFDREIYGRVPASTPKVNWEVVSKTSEVKDDLSLIHI